MATETSAVAIEAAANAAANTAAVIEGANERVDAVIEAANERVADAEENARRIAEAALEGERGQRIAALEQEIFQCRENNRILASDLQATRQELTELAGQVTALLTLDIISAAMSLPAATPAPSSSNPTTSQEVTQAATEAAETLDPLSLSAVAEAASPAVETKARKKRVI